MATNSGFNRNSGSGAVNQPIKLVIAGSFVVLILLAVGVPLLSKPKAIVNTAPVAVEAPKPVAEVEVFMALQRVAAGAQLAPNLFRKEKLSAQSIGALGGQIVKNETDIIGRFARTVILPGRPLLSDQLVDAPENILTRKIRPGFRAVTVKMDDVTGIEGWGTPGARVDVLWVSNQNQGKEDMLVTTIVKNAQVLSVMGRTDSTMVSNNPQNKQNAPPPGSTMPQASAPPPQVPTSFTVTLLVTPQDGQKLFLAGQSGRLSLMLRGEFDNAQDGGGSDGSVTTRRLIEGADGGGSNEDRLQGSAKVCVDSDTCEEWSVIDGRVWRWDKAQ